MSNLKDILGPNFKPPKAKKSLPTDPPDVQFKDAIANQGIEPPTHIVFDGKVHRIGSKKA